MGITNNLSKKVTTTYAPKRSERVSLLTVHSARIDARYDGDHAFEISSQDYYFAEADCREAAEFFTNLADILKEVKANA